MTRYDDLSEHPFSPENVRYESGAPDATERGWFAFLRAVEELLGLVRTNQNSALDGDQDTDGYSLDTAHDFFEKGETPLSYALQVNADRYLLGLPMLLHDWKK